MHLEHHHQLSFYHPGTYCKDTEPSESIALRALRQKGRARETTESSGGSGLVAQTASYSFHAHLRHIFLENDTHLAALAKPG